MLEKRAHPGREGGKEGRREGGKGGREGGGKEGGREGREEGGTVGHYVAKKLCGYAMLIDKLRTYPRLKLDSPLSAFLLEGKNRGCPAWAS